MEVNRRLSSQLAFETNSDMQAKYRIMKPCGFKTREEEEWLILLTHTK